MSHHLDCPQARADVRLDITDYYVFGGRAGTVFAVNVDPSIAGPDAPRGFHPEARYEVCIDADHDQVPELTYRLAFGPAGQAAFMTHSITPITAASGGDNGTRTDEKAPPEHGLFALLGKEGRGLISLARDALHETSGLVHEMHAQLHAKNTADDRELQQQLAEAVACLETTHNYLHMLSNVLEQRWPPDPEDPDVDP